MSFRNLTIATVAAAVVGSGALVVPASAQEEGIYIPLLTYRTGAFAGSGIPIADGMHDYLTMLNERDGGIGGVRLIIEECETGYATPKGVECYESVRSKNPVVVNPYSTGITLQLIPRAAVDKIPVLSMAYGHSASADGNLPLGVQPPGHLLGRRLGVREGTSPSARAGSRTSPARRWPLPPRRALRPRAGADPRGARREHGSSGSSIRSPRRTCRTRARCG